MNDPLRHYREIWLVDFEFGQPDGELPEIRCMVAREFRSGRVIRLWACVLNCLTAAPFPVGPDVLVVAFYSSAEWNCFRQLGWPLPQRVLDLYVEFRWITNGLPVPHGRGLLGAMKYYGLRGIDAAEKGAMRDLAIRGGTYTDQDRLDLLDYCQSDVDGLAVLLPAMLPSVDLPRALLRGRYMLAVSAMETTGIPIDTATLGQLRDRWGDIQDELVGRMDADYGVYDGRSFRESRFASWLVAHDLNWPHLESGRLALDRDTFRTMSKAHPVLAPLHELRTTLGEMRLFSNLAVGDDERNRCMLSPFSSRSSRNQPSNARYIFGPSAWTRGLIKPGRGRAIAHIDWSGQEYGIAAYLSRDPLMISDYESGDPYLGFGKRAGLVPATATKHSHRTIRDQLKVAMGLGAMYGAGPATVAVTIDRVEAFARELLRSHRYTYRTFWNWHQANVDHAMLAGWLETSFGWKIHVESEPNPRSLGNFLMQGNGAEMMRIACCLATERGIAVCGPIHDALLIEASTEEIDQAVAETSQAMAEASQAVLDGVAIRTDAEIVRWPDRYSDPRGRVM